MILSLLIPTSCVHTNSGSTVQCECLPGDRFLLWFCPRPIFSSALLHPSFPSHHSRSIFRRLTPVCPSPFLTLTFSPYFVRDPQKQRGRRSVTGLCGYSSKEGRHNSFFFIFPYTLTQPTASLPICD